REVIHEGADMLQCTVARHNALQNRNGLIAAHDHFALKPQLHRTEMLDHLPKGRSYGLNAAKRIHSHRIFQDGVVSPEGEPAIFVVIAEGLAVRVDRRVYRFGVWHLFLVSVLLWHLKIGICSGTVELTVCLPRRPNRYRARA